MGIEYKIALPVEKLSAIIQVLKADKCYQEFDERYKLYNFCWDEKPEDTMPNISIAEQDYGLYLCFHGGDKPLFDGFVKILKKTVEDTTGQSCELEEI